MRRVLLTSFLIGGMLFIPSIEAAPVREDSPTLAAMIGGKSTTWGYEVESTFRRRLTPGFFCFYSNGTYYGEILCENGAHLFYGEWQILDKTVQFTEVVYCNNAMIQSIKYTAMVVQITPYHVTLSYADGFYMHLTGRMEFDSINERR
jgi:hypothetical protein